MDHIKIIGTIQSIFCLSAVFSLLWVFSDSPVFFLLGYFDIIRPDTYSSQSLAAFFHYLPFAYFGIFLYTQPSLQWRYKISPHALFFILVGLTFPSNSDYLATMLLRLSSSFSEFLGFAIMLVLIILIILSFQLSADNSEEEKQHRLLSRSEVYFLAIIPVFVFFMFYPPFLIDERLFFSALHLKGGLGSAIFFESVLFLLQSAIFFRMLMNYVPLSYKLLDGRQELQFPTP